MTAGRNSCRRILDDWPWFGLLAETGAKDFCDFFSRCRSQSSLVFSIDADSCADCGKSSRMVGSLERAGIPVTWISVHSDKGHGAFLPEPSLFAPQISLASWEWDI